MTSLVQTDQITLQFSKLFCSAAFLVISYSLSTMLTKHIRETDKKRQSLLIDEEHSNKLASIGRLAAGEPMKLFLRPKRLAMAQASDFQ